MPHLFWLAKKKWNKNVLTVRKITTGQRDVNCFLAWLTIYQRKAKDDSNRSKHTRDPDPKAIQQINFTGNLECAGNTTMYFIIEEANEIILEFSKGTMKAL